MAFLYTWHAYQGMRGHLVTHLLGNVTVARWIITIFVFKSQDRVTHISNNILENIIQIPYCLGSLSVFVCFYNRWKELKYICQPFSLQIKKKKKKASRLEVEPTFSVSILL